MNRRLIRGFVATAVAGVIATSGWSQENLHSSSTPFNRQTEINNWTPPNGHLYDSQYGSRSSDFLFSPRYLATYFHLGEGVTIPITHRSVDETSVYHPPAEASPFISEPFYPHLTTLISEGGLPRSLENRLTKFRARRDAAAAELWDHLIRLESLPEDEAAAAWSKFETEHASAWEKIDRERKSLLSRFQSGGFMQPGVNLKDALSLVESADVHQEAVPIVSIAVIRYFVTSLSMEQRDLLGEVVHDLSLLEERSSDPSDVEPVSPWERPISRDALTAEQRAALSAYLETKNRLKQELVDSLMLLVPIDERNRQLKMATLKLRSSDPKVVQSALRDILDSDEFVLNWKELESVAAQLRKKQAPEFAKLDREFRQLMTTLAPGEDLPQTGSNEVDSPKSEMALEAATLARLDLPQRRLLTYANITR